jgi:transposase InsO family protein
MRKNNIVTKSPGRKEGNRQSDRITIGMDLGDKTSRYCVLDDGGEVIAERSVASTKNGMLRSFAAMKRCRIALEVILSVHYSPGSDLAGPSWLTFLGHMKDSLWSCDLFRCESATLRTFWVLVVMDQFTRRIVGFGVQCGNVDGPALGRMFQQAIWRQSLPE